MGAPDLWFGGVTKAASKVLAYSNTMWLLFVAIFEHDDFRK